jgi:hypothetical protein
LERQQFEAGKYTVERVKLLIWGMPVSMLFYLWSGKVIDSISTLLLSIFIQDGLYCNPFEGTKFTVRALMAINGICICWLIYISKMAAKFKRTIMGNIQLFDSKYIMEYRQPINIEGKDKAERKRIYEVETYVEDNVLHIIDA